MERNSGFAMTKIARQLLAGRVNLTFQSLRTGKNIKINAICKGSKPGTPKAYWTNTSYKDASVIKFQTPEKVDIERWYLSQYGDVVRTKNLRYGKSYKYCMEHLMTFLITGIQPSRMIIYSDNLCGVCMRPLTDLNSINYGIGPTCAKEFQRECLS